MFSAKRKEPRNSCGMAILLGACVLCATTAALGADTARITVSVVCDSAPPSGTIAINHGASWTTSLGVTLTLNSSDPVSGVTQMRFSNDGTAWSPWESYTTTKAWILATGNDGTRHVYTQFKDGAGNRNVGLGIAAAIIYDISPPTALLTLASGTPTSADVLSFHIAFDEALSSPLTAADVALTPGSLDGAIAVIGADLDYTVSITLADPDADGTVGITILGGLLTDMAGNTYAGGVSPDYTVHNWHGFTTQPADTRLYTGESHTFTVDADFGRITPAFQWKCDGPARKIIHDGPATPSWDITNASAADRGTYWCEVTYDGVVYESARATLSVEDHLAITQQPQSVTVFPHGSCTFTVAASGGYTPLRYQWKKDGASIPNATQASLTLTNLRVQEWEGGTGDAGIYTVEIADDETDAVASDPAYLNLPVGIPVTTLAGWCLLFALTAAGGISRIRKK